MTEIRKTEDLRYAALVVQQRLGDLEKKTPNVLKNAVNQTARRYRQRIEARVQEEYAPAKRSMIRGNNLLKLRQAKPGDLTARLTSQSAMSELLQFQAKPKKVTNEYKRRPKFYSANVLKSSGLRSLDGSPKPFVVRFKSGHVAFVVRDPRRRMKSDSRKQRVKKLLSPAVPHMIENDRVDGVKIADEYVRQDLMDMINTQVEKVLGGKK